MTWLIVAYVVGVLATGLASVWDEWTSPERLPLAVHIASVLLWPVALLAALVWGTIYVGVLWLSRLAEKYKKKEAQS